MVNIFQSVWFQELVSESEHCEWIVQQNCTNIAVIRSCADELNFKIVLPVPYNTVVLQLLVTITITITTSTNNNVNSDSIIIIVIIIIIIEGI